LRVRFERVPFAPVSEGGVVFEEDEGAGERDVEAREAEEE